MNCHVCFRSKLESACFYAFQWQRLRESTVSNSFSTVESMVELGFVLILNFRESEQLKLGKMSRNLCHWKLFPGMNCAYSRDARSSVLGSLTL